MRFANDCGLCDHEAVTTIANVKLYSVCERRVQAIEQDAHDGPRRAPLTRLPKEVRA